MIVVVPMAGRGSRFANTGIDIPKPLIPVRGKPMVAWALQSLEGVQYTRIIFVALREHEKNHGVSYLVRALTNRRTEVLLLDDVTDGQLRTVLAAREFIDSQEDVLIASSDTLVVSNLGSEIQQRDAETAGIISVADLPGDRWSFARTDSSGNVVEVAEKVRISDHASTGLYYFSNGKRFVETADEMIQRGQKTRGEYYVIPVYQKMIDEGLRIGLSKASRMWDMGTPEAKAAYEHFTGM